MAHINYKIDNTVEVYVVYKNKVLLRKHDKYGIWLSVGGHIEINEDANSAAIREVKEEVGLDVELYTETPLPTYEGYHMLVIPQSINQHKINDTHNHIAQVYFAKSKTDNLILSETEKSEDCKWFTKEELDSSKYQIKEYIKDFAKIALEKLKTD